MKWKPVKKPTQNNLKQNKCNKNKTLLSIYFQETIETSLPRQEKKKKFTSNKQWNVLQVYTYTYAYICSLSVSLQTISQSVFLLLPKNTIIVTKNISTTQKTTRKKNRIKKIYFQKTIEHATYKYISAPYLYISLNNQSISSSSCIQKHNQRNQKKKKPPQLDKTQAITTISTKRKKKMQRNKAV